MNTAPRFTPSLITLEGNAFTKESLRPACDLFDSKQYAKSIGAVLHAINPTLVSASDAKSATSFHIPHGSIVIEVEIKDTEYRISAPFLQVPEKGSVALMRQIAEINFSVLVLTQIVLKENQLYFEFSAPLELCDPYKLFSVLREMCIQADYYDDVFREKFDATWITEPKITTLPDATKEAAWNVFQDHIKECFEYFDYFEQKRFDLLCMDIMCTTLMKIDYTIAPQGFLRSEMEKVINGMFQNMPLNDLIRKTKDGIKKLSTLDRKLVEDSLYIPQFFIPYKSMAEMATVQDMLKKHCETTKQHIANSDYMSATMMMLFAIYNLNYKFMIPASVSKILNKSLQAAAGATWKDASSELLHSAEKILDMNA